jgi:phage shock protein PspC (stress-responsive transcriptional regulator)
MSSTPPERRWLAEAPTPETIERGHSYTATGTVGGVAVPPDRPTNDIRPVLLDILAVVFVLVGGLGLAITLYRIDPQFLYAAMFAAVAIGGTLIALRRA